MDAALNQALRKIFLFRDLSDDTLNAIASAAETLMIDRGEMVVNEGADPDGMYLLRSGSVRVTKQGTDSDVVMLGSGSHFGEMSLLDNAKRSASVIANERCELIRLNPVKLHKKLAGHPELAAPFYRAVAVSLAKRLRATTDDLGMARQFLRDHSHLHHGS